MYITTSDQLNDFCKSLESSDVLAVDTEFVRERTYFHRIGLIQVAGKEGCGAIDPILLKDLTPLLEILKDPNKIKVIYLGVSKFPELPKKNTILNQKPYLLTVEMDDPSKNRISLVEFMSNNRIRVVTGQKKPSSMGDGEVMEYEWRAE